MRNNIDESIGYYIKKYRKEKGLTQSQLGELLDVSQAMIAQYEKGMRHPKIETLRKIAFALDVKLADFLEANQTLIDESEDGIKDTLIKDTEGSLYRHISTSVSVFNNNSHQNFDDVIEKLNLLNTLGQTKAIEYITDLTEQKKYLKDTTK